MGRRGGGTGGGSQWWARRRRAGLRLARAGRRRTGGRGDTGPGAEARPGARAHGQCPERLRRVHGAGRRRSGCRLAGSHLGSEVLMTGLSSWLRVQWDRVGAVGAALIGVAALALGWAGVSGTPHIAEQLPYFISGGLVALFFLGMAVTLWLSADLPDEWRELRALRLILADSAPDGDRTPASTPGTGPG